MSQELQQKLLRELRYDAETGQFFRACDGRVKKAGEKVGHFNKALGYVTVNWNGGNKYAHRLAWLYAHGYFPKYIDHINGDRADNRLCNLREATQSQNLQNITEKPYQRNPVVGASFVKRICKWSSQINVNGEKKRLGYFDSADEAHSAYVAAKAIHHTFNPVLRSSKSWTE